MNRTSLANIPPGRYFEYALVLNPNEDLQQKILMIKKGFSERYKVYSPLFYTKPYITLVKFIQAEIMEPRLANRLKTIASAYSSFNVELKDFGSYPSHTLFINLESKQQLQNLSKQLRSAQQLMTWDKDNKAHFLTNPNITIAARLLPWQYEQGWLDYSHRHFSGRFIANGMLLLKRILKMGDSSPNSKYQTVQKFDFMNLKINQAQAELF